MSSEISEADKLFVENLPTRIVISFRKHVFPEAFISKNPQIFLDNEWINIEELRIFMASPEIRIRSDRTAEVLGQSRLGLGTKVVKLEQDVPISVKIEPETRRVLNLIDKEVIEILSDSDDEIITRVVKEELPEPASIKVATRSKLKGPVAKERNLKKSSNLDAFDPSKFTQKSDTVWTDSDIISHRIDEVLQVTLGLQVNRVEYLSEIPNVWPVPQVSTAFIVDLRDSKFLQVRKGSTDSALAPLRPDSLIENKDQDSWSGGTGTADSTARVCFQPGHLAVICRRSRLACKGCYACSAVDPKLLMVTRTDLDPVTRSNILTAKRETREDERASTEQRAATFLSVCRVKCPAVDGNGKACAGGPKMKEKSLGKQTRGHRYWIACSGWRKWFKNDHKTHVIPDDIDEDILEKLLNGTPLAGDSDTNPCSLVLSAHVGLKLHFCRESRISSVLNDSEIGRIAHPHINGGLSLSRTPIKNYPCPSRCTLYIPIDESLRFALRVYPGNIPHNHPMPRMSKASFETKAAYRDCVNASGTVGMTVQKVDQAASTSILLGGQRPAQYNSSLNDSRIKREIIQDVKSKAHPAGLGLPGAYELYRKDLVKDIDDRYIHSFINTPEGGTIIFTCVPFLLGLVHEVSSFECDVTFKRVQLLNEWEMVIYYPPVQRAVTIACVYIDTAATDHYERLFDELQLLVESLTGTPLRFKRLSPGGNLLCMNADMEAAQVLGAGKSIMKTYDPGFSNIHVDTAEELLPYFIRLCYTHSKRAVLDFKGLVCDADFQRLMDFPYIDSEEELELFTIFIRELGIKKIKDWWNHKIKSKWIIPCIIKSQSKILSEHWPLIPSTTNIGESQHHWTNKLSGIKLPLVEGIETARLIDDQVADEIRESLRMGILKNPHTDLFYRQARASQRLTSAAKKVRETAEIQATTENIQLRVDAEKESRHNSLLLQRQYEDELKFLTRSTAGTGQAMGVDIYNQTSDLRAKIENEKELRRKSNLIQKTLTAEMITAASSTGAPRHQVAKTGKSVYLSDASSCGRVLPERVARLSHKLQVEALVEYTTAETPLARHPSEDNVDDSAFALMEAQEQLDDPDADMDDIASAFPGQPSSGCELPSPNNGLISRATSATDFFSQADSDWGLFKQSTMGLPSDEEFDSGIHSSIPVDYYNSEPEDAFFSNMMSSKVQFGFEGDVGTDFNFGNGYFNIGQVEDIQKDLNISEHEGEGYNFPFHPPNPVYIPPSGNWSTTYPEILLPPVPVDSPSPPYDMSVKVQPPKVIGEKQPRLAEFGEENILPDDEVRKRVKTSRYVELQL